MPNIGDLVTNLICDASNYTKGTDQARAGNKALGGSIDQIIGGLERQKKALEKANQKTTTHENILNLAADDMAVSNKTKEALALNLKVEALKKARQAEDEANAAKLRGQQAGQSLIATLEKEKATYGMTAAQLRIYNATQAGASAADIARVQTLNREIDALQHAKNAQDHLRQSSNAAAGASGNLNRGSMILTETTRGLEDAVSGYTNNGLKGMLMATTNNINQVGALMGGNAGLILSFGSIGAILGVSLIPKIVEYASGTADLTKKTEEMAAASKKAFEAEMSRMDRLTERFARDRATRRAFGDDMRNPGNVAELEAKRRQIEAEKHEMGFSRTIELGAKRMAIQREKLESEEEAKRRGASKTWTISTVLDYGTLGLWGQAKANENAAMKERQTESDRRKELMREIDLKNDDIKAATRLAGEQLVEIDKQIADARIVEARRAHAEEWLAEQERNAKQKQEEEKRAKAKLSAQLGDMRAFASQLEGNIKAIDPKTGEQHDIEKRRKQIEIDRERGLINQQEADVLNRANVMKPDAPVGNAAAIQAGTKEAYSSIIRSMRANEQVKYQQEQAALAKDQLKILEKIETAIKTKDETVLVDFP